MKHFWVCLLWLGAVAFGQIERGPSVRNAAAFPGKDIGAQINAAYSALPATGGAIMVTESASFDTPVVFGTKDKPVLLMGLPGDIVTLTYTGAFGTALTFDYGTRHRMGHGLRADAPRSICPKATAPRHKIHAQKCFNSPTLAKESGKRRVFAS